MPGSISVVYSVPAISQCNELHVGIQRNGSNDQRQHKLNHDQFCSQCHVRQPDGHRHQHLWQWNSQCELSDHGQPVTCSSRDNHRYCHGLPGSIISCVQCTGHNNATSYTWAYSGTGATINGSTNSITINFAANATSGNLTVTGTNTCGNGTVSANYPITVSPLPAAAGAITGTATVCQGASSVVYSVPAINNATSYTWAYSGTGATINGSTNSITINFAANATSGNLTVTGTNTCGNGTVSANYPITVSPLPAAAGAITGTATVCQGAIRGDIQCTGH